VQDLSSHTVFGREAKERYEAALARHPYRETLVPKQLDAIDASETCEKGAEEKEGEDHLADLLKKKSSISRMRFRDFERIRQSRHAGLKPDTNRHGTLDDE
jgi:hypothetical protein